MEILKRPASPDFSIWDCSKGTIDINVPLNYLLSYLHDLDRTADYDDMFLTGKKIYLLINQKLCQLTTQAGRLRRFFFIKWKTSLRYSAIAGLVKSLFLKVEREHFLSDIGQVVEILGDLTQIVYMEYKGIWPVSGRDFCSVSATRILEDDIVVFFAKHVRPSRNCDKTTIVLMQEYLLLAFTIDRNHTWV